MRRAAKADTNQRDIVTALRDVGASVTFIGRPVDLLVGFGARNYLLEVKRPDARPRADQEGQRLFIAAWRGEIVTVRSPEEALTVIGAR